MLRKELSKRQIILFLVIVAAVLGLLYYRFAWTYFQEQKRLYDTSSIEDRITVEEAKAVRIRNMTQAIEEGKASGKGVIATYDNLKQEINELNDIFGEAQEFSFGFDQAQSSGSTVRRRINATFTAESYEQAKQMLIRLHDGPYRCLLTDVSMVTTSSGTGRAKRENNLNTDAVQVSFNVTFFETLQDADTSDGLQQTDQNR